VARKAKQKSSQPSAVSGQRRRTRYDEQPEHINPVDGVVLEDAVAADYVRRDPNVEDRRSQAESDETRSSATAAAIPNCVYRDDAHGIWLYQGNCLAILDAIAAKYSDGCFDMIFADPPYFLSNGGITCHAGRMVKVDKGEWDRSKGPELNHEFNTEWLRRCQRVLKPNGTMWVTGTHHVIFSVGFAMQQLGMKILNDIAWEKPNPPPNLSCRYFTHSTETVLWAAKSDKSRHVFNYKAMKAVTGKQMKTVWRKGEFTSQKSEARSAEDKAPDSCILDSHSSARTADPALESVWTLPSPARSEKEFGKHPTQKPVALVERCLLAATTPGDTVLDPFMGAGTTGVACYRQCRHFVGIELSYRYVWLAGQRLDTGVIRVRFEIDLDLPDNLIDRSAPVSDKPEIQAERIFHETKFVFLSCAQARTGSVVHTTVDADVQSAWSHTPQSIKLATTHIVRCETEILRVKSS
jgi:site-specific DNA-methyltransferase (adenine-specific)